MSYEVRTIAPFDRQLKRLAKKYPSIKSEIAALVSSLRVDPLQGSAIGNGTYKVRLAIRSKGKGRSGGARLIASFYTAAIGVPARDL